MSLNAPLPMSLNAPLPEERATSKLAAAIQTELQAQMRTLMIEMSQRVVELCTQLSSKRFSEALEEDRIAKVRAAASKGAEFTAEEAARASAAILVSAAAVASGTDKPAAVKQVTSALDPQAKRAPRPSVLKAMAEIQDLISDTDIAKGKGKFKAKEGKGPFGEQQRKGPGQGLDEGKGKGRGKPTQDAVELPPEGKGNIMMKAGDPQKGAKTGGDMGAKGLKGGVPLDANGKARRSTKGSQLHPEAKGNSQGMPSIPEDPTDDVQTEAMELGATSEDKNTSSSDDKGTSSSSSTSEDKGTPKGLQTPVVTEGKGGNPKGKGKPKGQAPQRASVMDGLFGGLFG